VQDLEAKYQDSLDFIYSFVDFSMKRHVDDAHRFFKLDRMNQLMALMDYPHKRYPSVHVAGTKGKGSTASFIAQALIAAGYKWVCTPHRTWWKRRNVFVSTGKTSAKLIL